MHKKYKSFITPIWRFIYVGHNETVTGDSFTTKEWVKGFFYDIYRNFNFYFKEDCYTSPAGKKWPCWKYHAPFHIRLFRFIKSLPIIHAIFARGVHDNFRVRKIYPGSWRYVWLPMLIKKTIIYLTIIGIILCLWLM